MSRELNQYIQEALAAGSDKRQIAADLTEAGWSVPVVQRVLDQYAGVDAHGLVIPVPRLGMHHLIRDIFVYLLIFISLAMGSFALGWIFFELIHRAFPDPAATRWGRGFSWAIAQLVVTTPLYFWLSSWLGRDLEVYPQKRESLVRKLMIYAILLITALIGIADLIRVITRLLDGELTSRFSLQALTVLGISSGIFTYYLMEMKRDDQLVRFRQQTAESEGALNGNC